MPIDVRWYDDEETIVCYEFTGRWTLEELYTAIDRAHELGASRDYTVDMIVDLLGSQRTPRNVLSIVSYASRKKLLNIGAVVLLTRDRVIRSVAGVVIRLTPLRGEYKFAATLEEALDIIERSRTVENSPV